MDKEKILWILKGLDDIPLEQKEKILLKAQLTNHEFEMLKYRLGPQIICIPRINIKRKK